MKEINVTGLQCTQAVMAVLRELMPMNDNEEMFFFGKGEIDKPIMLDIPIGEIVAFSNNGLHGKHIFTQENVSDVENMNIEPAPKWVRDLNLARRTTTD